MIIIIAVSRLSTKYDHKLNTENTDRTNIVDPYTYN